MTGIAFGRGFGHGLGGYGRCGGVGRGAGFVGHGFLFPGLGLFVGLGVLALVVIAFWSLYKKAGYEGGLALLMLIPLVNLGAMLFLAFSDWPVHRELREARSKAAGAVETGDTATSNLPETADEAETTTPEEPA